MSKLVNDSWVKVRSNEISDEQQVDVFHSINDSQKVLNNTIIFNIFFYI